MEENYKNIDEIIVAFLCEDITEKEMKELNDWKLLSNDNQDKFDQMVVAWNKSESIAVFNQIDVSKDWENVCHKIEELKKPVKHANTFFISARKIAAILVPIIFISLSGLVYWNVPGFGRLTASEMKSSVQTIELPDGSKVTINKDSKIIYPKNLASASERNVKLQGEAFFEVFHNTTPFSVEVQSTTVSVLGTKFNIEEKQSDILVSVISGKVAVKNNNIKVDLTAGERAWVNDGVLNEEKAETLNDIYWYSKSLKFKQASIADICKELQNNFEEVKIVKINTKDLSTKVTTSFNNQSLQEIIEELEIHFSKKITFEGYTLTVSD